MQDIVLQPLIDELLAAQPSLEVYVIDADLHVLLAGTSQADIAPVADGNACVPFDLVHAVQRILDLHDFTRTAVARTSTGKKSLRVVRLAGPSGAVYGIVARKRRRS